MRRLFSDIEETSIASQYQLGINTQELANAFGTNRTTICNALSRQGVRRRGRSEANRRYSFSQTSFAEHTPAAHYWIGFLLADGSVAGNELSIGLAVRDKGHLYKLKEFLGAQHPVRNPARFAIRSDALVSQLSTFGIVPRKSGNETAPDYLLGDRDFWRGVVDGDGSISRSGTEWRISICGSQFIVSHWLDFVRSHVTTTAKTCRTQSDKCWQAGVHMRKAAIVARTLYQDSVVSLDRKQCLANQLIETLLEDSQDPEKGSVYAAHH